MEFMKMNGCMPPSIGQQVSQMAAAVRADFQQQMSQMAAAVGANIREQMSQMAAATNRQIHEQATSVVRAGFEVPSTLSSPVFIYIDSYAPLNKMFYTATCRLSEIVKNCSALDKGRRERMQYNRALHKKIIRNLQKKIIRKLRRYVSIFVHHESLESCPPRKRGYGINSTCRRDESGNIIEKNTNTGHLDVVYAEMMRVV
jgi:hypothetical protein